MAGKPHKGKYDDEVSDFIDEFWKREFHAPTIREVMVGCGIMSTQVADYVIKKMAKSRGDIFSGPKGSTRRITPRWVMTAIQNATVTK